MWLQSVLLQSLSEHSHINKAFLSLVAAFVLYWHFGDELSWVLSRDRQGMEHELLAWSHTCEMVQKEMF